MTRPNIIDFGHYNHTALKGIAVIDAKLDSHPAYSKKIPNSITLLMKIITEAEISRDGFGAK
jgi:hypothetical protein